MKAVVPLILDRVGCHIDLEEMHLTGSVLCLYSS